MAIVVSRMPQPAATCLPRSHQAHMQYSVGGGVQVCLLNLTGAATVVGTGYAVSPSGDAVTAVDAGSYVQAAEVVPHGQAAWFDMANSGA